MTPPEARRADPIGAAGQQPPAVSLCAPETLKKRADFLAAARARRQSMPGMVVQARRRSALENGGGMRVGYTCSKKVGNAVARNRAKRRLRAAAHEVFPQMGRNGWDYVLIGRHAATAARDWPLLLDDLRRALALLHGQEATA